MPEGVGKRGTPRANDIIVLSGAEVEFLRKVTNGGTPRVHGRHSAVHRALHRKLRELSEGASSDTDRFVFPITAAELEHLQAVTKAAYSFITTEERRARLVLREKMWVSSRNLGLSWADGGEGVAPRSG